MTLIIQLLITSLLSFGTAHYPLADGDSGSKLDRKLGLKRPSRANVQRQKRRETFRSHQDSRSGERAKKATFLPRRKKKRPEFLRRRRRARRPMPGKRRVKYDSKKR
ncbi:MAG: hypothetical protein HOE90_22980 [Bacteriovoracaceae bacterium]|nr:hypothetical protein [Bacteriovoracaceae bacterium]